jgi:hypothetical protein
VQHARSPVPELPGSQPRGPARTILIADSVWDLLLGVGLIVATVSAVTRSLGAEPLRPWPLPVALGAACLVASAFLLYAIDRGEAVNVCRLISPGNMAATVVGVALLSAFPHPAHTYVVALAVASVGCAIFAVFEWTVRAEQ